jgi:hypothetical protein
MTLLGGIQLAKKVLVASDGIVMHTDESGMSYLRESVPKVWKHPSVPTLIWAYTGDVGIGVSFNEWVETQAPMEAWPVLLEAASEKLATLNGEARRRAKIAEKQREGISALFGGYIDAVGKVALVADDGGVLPLEQDTVLFLGGGAPHAKTAWQALQMAMGKDFDPADAFRIAMDAAIEVVPALGGPTQMYSASQV